MILAAGLGTRLRPLTLERAKPSIPLLAKPLLLRLLEKLAGEEVSEFRINLHHLPESIKKIFESHDDCPYSVSFSFEPEILGTAGGLKNNEDFFERETFIMANGDIIADFRLSEAVRFHKERKAIATLVLYPQELPYRYSPIRVDKNFRLRQFKELRLPGDEPVPQAYVFTGIHILEPEILDFIPNGIFCEINETVYPSVIEEGIPIYGFPVTGYWNDLGEPDRYLEAQRHLFLTRNIPPHVCIAPDVLLPSHCRMGPFVSVERGCVIESECDVENAIILEQAHIKKGAGIRNCIVGAGVTVEGIHCNKIISRHGTVAFD